MSSENSPVLGPSSWVSWHSFRVLLRSFPHLIWILHNLICFARIHNEEWETNLLRVPVFSPRARCHGSTGGPLPGAGAGWPHGRVSPVSSASVPFALCIHLYPSELVLLTINQRSCTITEKAPTRAFSWLRAPTTTFTFMTLLRLCLMDIDPTLSICENGTLTQQLS